MSNRLCATVPAAENVRAVAGGFLTSKDKLRFFVEGKSGSCMGIPGCKPALGTYDGNTTTGTATMRRDGFASVGPSSASGPGVLTTEPLAFGSLNAAMDTFLFINVALKTAASLQVELMIGGVAKLTSVTIHGHRDVTQLLVRWVSGNGTSSSVGHWPPHSLTTQLRFTLMGGAELYAFWLTYDGNCGRSNGPVAGGGGEFVSGWDRAPCHTQVDKNELSKQDQG